MQRLVIDETLPEKLLKLNGSVELVDKDGQLIAVVERRYDPAYYDLDPGISDEEMERRANSTNWIPADEIVPRLRKLV
ncbi:MAG: hypothetical protein K2X82_25280 [Gemmataceae bacterium]|nr:hypothetical protein [Gemmataceae bacterium]